MISVIMSVYKESEEYLRKSIESILAQTLHDFEYIIVLDNPDNKIAIKILNEYAERDRRIKFFINEKNMGLTKSLNRALEYVSGDYVVRMDADDISEPDRLENQLEYLTKMNLDFVGSSMRRISETGEIVMQITNKSYPPEIVNKLLMFDDCVPHPTWMLKTEVYKELNGYREIDTCEDYDFLLRALKRGFRIGICDKILLNYRINTKGISQSNVLVQMLSANYLRENFDRIESITQNEINNYLTKKCSDKENRNYAEAVHDMNLYLERIKSGERSNLIRLPFLVFKSKYIFINFTKIIRMQKIKMQAATE